MNKKIKIYVTCPQCATKLPVSITEEDLGKKKAGVCPKCQKKLTIPISTKLASKFESDPTIGGVEAELSVLLETIPNAMTVYQSFELTSDYYTIGRKNSGGPEFRPDVEVVTSDKRMSRKHAAIRKKGKTGFTIEDIGSKNGVILNGKKLEVDKEDSKKNEIAYLSDGDTFCLGDTQFRVSIAEHSNDGNDQTC